MEPECTDPVSTLVCPVCHKEFDHSSRSHRAKYCSPECYRLAKAARRKDRSVRSRKCRLCGKEFKVSGDNRKFCSVDCCAVYHTSKTKIRRKLQRMQVRSSPGEEKPVPRKCVWCGKDFFRRKGEKLLYCSPECKHEAKVDFARAFRARRAAGVEIEPRKPREKSFATGTVRNCEICGTPFAQRTRTCKYCSPRCAYVSATLRQKAVYRKKLETNNTSATPCCIHCGKPLPEGVRSAFCSRKCMQHHIECLASASRRKFVRVCAECGREYNLGEDSKLFRYCSESCAVAANRRLQYQRYHEKMASMTPEERRAYQDAVNAQIRELRVKRKQEFYGNNDPDGG